MSISTYRKLTTTDCEKLEAAAKRFALRNQIEPDADRWGNPIYLNAVEFYVMHQASEYQYSAPARNWMRIMARVLQVPASMRLAISGDWIGCEGD